MLDTGTAPYWTSGLLGLAAGRLRLQQGLFELIVSALVAAAAYAAAIAGFGAAPSVSTIAGLIIVLPGFSLTIAMTELAARHLVSGTARLAGAFTVFLAMTFGVAVGRQLATSVLGPALLDDDRGDTFGPGASGYGVRLLVELATRLSATAVP